MIMENRMIILTAGNYRFKDMIRTSVGQAEKFGYMTAVYDLGGLGFGKPFVIKNTSFHEKGYYEKINGLSNRQTRATHKPDIIRDCFNNSSDFAVYLDGDCILADKIDEVIMDYDVGLTVRPTEEVEKRRQMHGAKADFYEGYINAGVMFFNNTNAAMHFIDIWAQKTGELKNDQAALNNIFSNFFPIKAGQLIELDGVKIRMFDAKVYNYYFFGESNKIFNKKNAKILHFKNNRRDYYDAHFKPCVFYCKKFLSLLKTLISLK
jgi:hypothetical protein